MGTVKKNHSWFSRFLHQDNFFMLSALLVNGGNYLYNLLLGRILGPVAFSDAAILVTLLLIFSFLGMTFQVTVAKYSGRLDDLQLNFLLRKLVKITCGIALCCSLFFLFASHYLQAFLHTNSAEMFVIFGLGLPFYFLLSLNRGIFQGKQQVKALAVTYQFEMWSRLVFTFFLLLCFSPYIASNWVAVGMALSFIAGLFPFNKRLKKVIFKYATLPKIVLTTVAYRAIKDFFIVMIVYEFTQILINNSDILLVKHFFQPYDAGLYAALALIGRVVYFIAWTFVMLLLPKVVALQKEGKNPYPLLYKNIVYVLVLSGFIVLFTALFPVFSITLFFGRAYIAVASLLGWYALATALLALSNIFCYFYLSLDKYMPVGIAGMGGLLQVVLICFFHSTLSQVVYMQVVAMGLLLLGQTLYFRVHKNRFFTV